MQSARGDISGNKDSNPSFVQGGDSVDAFALGKPSMDWDCIDFLRAQVLGDFITAPPCCAKDNRDARSFVFEAVYKKREFVLRLHHVCFLGEQCCVNMGFCLH